MSLTYHNAVLAPQTVGSGVPDSPATFSAKANANWTLGKTELQAASDALQDALSSLFGQGLLTVPTVTVSASSLTVTISDFKALIGAEVVWSEDTVNLLASQSGASLYFCQDGTFSTTLPTTKSYCVIGTYTTTGTGVTTFTVAGHLLLPTLVTVTGTVAAINVPDDVDYVEGYVDHSSTTLFAVDGCLKLNVDDTDAFTVEELYPGGMVDLNSDFLHIPPRQRTNGGFHYKISRQSAYSYSAEPVVTLTYTRTGLALAQ